MLYPLRHKYFSQPSKPLFQLLQMLLSGTFPYLNLQGRQTSVLLIFTTSFDPHTCERTHVFHWMLRPEVFAGIVDVTAARFWHYCCLWMFTLLAFIWLLFFSPFSIWPSLTAAGREVLEQLRFVLFPCKSSMSWPEFSKKYENGRRRFPKLLFRAAQERS